MNKQVSSADYCSALETKLAKFTEAKKVWLRVLLKDWWSLEEVQQIDLKIERYLDDIDIFQTTDADIAAGFADWI